MHGALPWKLCQNLELEKKTTVSVRDQLFMFMHKLTPNLSTSE